MDTEQLMAALEAERELTRLAYLTVKDHLTELYRLHDDICNEVVAHPAVAANKIKVAWAPLPALLVKLGGGIRYKGIPIVWENEVEW